MDPLRKVAQSTIEDAVHSSFRYAELTGSLRRVYLRYTITTLGVSILPSIFFPYGFHEKVLLTLAVFVLVMLAMTLLFRTNVKMGLRKEVIKALGTDQPIECEYELSEEGVIFRKTNHTIRVAWDILDRVLETKDSLEIIYRPAGILVIPKRIFAEGELADWKAVLQSHAGSGIPRR